MLPISSALAGTETDVRWSILVAFHDRAARRRAMRVCDNMVARFWPEMEFQMHWCSFDQLASADVANVAARHAALANIIIIATAADAGLPDAVKAWMARWCEQRHGREGALIALVEGSQENQILALTHQDLRNAAHRAGLDYLTHEPAFALAPLPDESASFSLKAAEVGPVLEGILDQTYSTSKAERLTQPGA